ncbi:MAG: thiamine phosphate synthase [Alphaproteobacteria bacterium]|nr:thiamine phosphate synthase [Alphaproteobacteria bacterium]
MVAEARRLGAVSGFAKPGARATSWPSILAFTDPLRTPDPLALCRTLPRGCAVVYRAFGDPKAVEIGRRLRRATRQRGLAFFVGADIALARRVQADGLHLPERLAGRKGAILDAGRRFLVSAAAHDASAILRARGAGVRALVVSAIFPSESPSAGKPLGVRRLAVLVRTARMPVYALGGVNPTTVRALRRSGVVGVAGVGAFSPRTNPAPATRPEGEPGVRT